jgi:drug/metabolite transporter (DMT)-like permease
VAAVTVQPRDERRAERQRRVRAAAGAVGLGTVFVLIWSSGYLVGTIGTRSGATLGLVAWRFLVALVALSALTVLTRAPWPREPRTYLHLVVTGVLLQTTQLAGVYLGLARGVPAGLSSLVMSAAPLIIAAAAVPLFGERLTRRQWLGLGLGLAGVGISLSTRLSGGQQVTGYACTVVALLGFAAGTLYQKRFGARVDLRTGITVQLAGATATAFPLAALHGGLHLPLTAGALGALTWLSLVNSIGSFALLFTLLRRRPGGAATSLLYLVPPVTAVLAVPVLGQSVGVAVFAGMAVSGAGVLLVNSTSTR